MSLASEVLDGRIVAGARLIRWLEDGDARGRVALRELFPHAGRAHLVGITGPPGAGKSTLVDALVAELRRRGRKVGVIAVDPTSPFTGGAILGDRLRMQRHATDPDVFIRSMGTRGELGGLARASFEASLVMDAMGYDPVIVETVGVGQDEVEIGTLAHTTVVVGVPGLGDEIQAIKAGVLEAGQVYVVNKADRPGAAELRRQLEMMLRLRATGGRADDWAPPIIDTVASEGRGCDALVDALGRHREYLQASGRFARQFAARTQLVFLAELGAACGERLLAAAQADPQAAAILADVRAGNLDPYTAVAALLARLLPATPRGSSS